MAVTLETMVDASAVFLPCPVCFLENFEEKKENKSMKACGISCKLYLVALDALCVQQNQPVSLFDPCFIPPPHTWIVISTLTMESLLLGFTTNGMTSILPLLTFHS